MILSKEQFAVRAGEEVRHIRITFARFWWRFRGAKILQEVQLTSGRQIGHRVIPAAGAAAMNGDKVFSRKQDSNHRFHHLFSETRQRFASLRVG